MIRRVGVVGLLVLVATVAFTQGADAPRVATADALRAAVAAGGVVWLEPGDYALPATLVIDRDVELRSVEPLAATLLLQAAPLGVRVEGGAHARFVGVRLAYDAEAPGDAVHVHDARATFEGAAIGLAVAAADGAPDAYGRGLLLTGAARVEVLGGGLGRHEGVAAEIRDGAQLHLEGVLLAGNDAGVVASGTARVTWLDVEFRDHFGFALALHGRAEARGRGSLFEQNGRAEGEDLISAVYVGDAARLVLEGSDVFRDHPGGAFELAGAAHVALTAPTVEATGTWAHTYAVGQATLLVEGGRFAGNEGAFYVGEGARAVLDGVSMTGGAAEAVVVDDHAFVEVRGGAIEDHGGFGLAAYGSARAHVDGATVLRNRSGLVAMGAATLLVRDADVAEHERTGIAFLDAASGEAIGNRVRGNGWTGVVVAGEAVAAVVGNALEANAQRGAWFDEAGSGRFEANTVRRSPVGLEVAPGATPELGTNAFQEVGTDVVRPR